MSSELHTTPMSTFSIRLPKATRARLDAVASSLRRSRNFVLAEAVEQYLDLHARQIAHIEEGLADLEAGRVHSHEEIQDLVRELERLAEDDAR